MRTMVVNSGLTRRQSFGPGPLSRGAVLPVSHRADRPRSAVRASRFYRRHAKRWTDLALATLMVLPVTAAIAIIAALVALDGGRPFYVQPRVGFRGRIFPMFKIRTMVPDAEAALERHLEANPAARAEWAHHQKLRDDPRITRLGQFLRRSSLDELPQFYNVLRGDMALVGPRPFMPSQKDYYEGREYYAMRPGITGFWQTSVRNEASFAQRAAYDRSYYHALSPMTDLRTIWRTLLVVMRGTGS
ncbi:sugar transferase [Limimaricola sp.]|uniref:sugar transferase n=1 Tax=Limimaricola sp. TaxID=2211665 RepID=UPI004058FFAB